MIFNLFKTLIAEAGRIIGTEYRQSIDFKDFTLIQNRGRESIVTREMILQFSLWRKPIMAITRNVEFIFVNFFMIKESI